MDRDEGIVKSKEDEDGVDDETVDTSEIFETVFGIALILSILSVFSFSLIYPCCMKP